MAQSYFVRHETTDAVATYEALATLGTINQPCMEQIAVLGIFNEVDSGCVTRIKRIEINELQARTGTLPNNLSIIRTTAQSGGQAITPIQHDTDGGTLPDEVLIAAYPGAITQTGGPIRKMLGKLGLQPFNPLTGLSSPRIGNLKGAFSGTLIYNCFESDTQRFILREGEGVALTTGDSAPSNFPYELAIHVSDGTDTYLINTVVNNCAMTALFGIFNGSGSGVTLSIDRIAFSELRESAGAALFTVETISNLSRGIDLPVIPMDTANEAIPSGLKIAKNCVPLTVSPNSQAFLKSRESGDLPIRRALQPSFGVSPGLASGLLTLMNVQNIVFDFSNTIDADGGFVLREGEGLAIFNRPFGLGFSSEMINYAITVYFTNVYTPPPSGGGEHSHVFVG